MFTAALQGAAWCAALGVLAYTPPASAEGEFSRAAACALPFVLLAGVPRVPRAREVTSREPAVFDDERAGAHAAWRSAALWLALALAPLAAAARVDVLSGAELGVTVAVCAVASLATFVFAWASARADGGGVHAACWFGAALGAPAFAATVALATGTPRAPAWPEWLASASPLTWVWHAARAPAAPPLDVSLLAAAAGLALVVASARVRPRAESRA